MLGALEASKVGTVDRWYVGVLSNDEIAYFWPQINEALDVTKELWEEFYTKESILDGLAHEKFFLMGAAKDDNFCLLTLISFHDYPAGRRLTCFWMYGEGLEEAARLLDEKLEQFAVTVGAKYIDGYGRKGYERMLRPYGYRYVRSHYSRRVTNKTRH